MGAFAELTRVGSVFEAQLLAGFLESHGIGARVPDEEVVGLYDGAATIWSGGVRVDVGSADLARAEELFKEWQERKDDSVDDEES